MNHIVTLFQCTPAGDTDCYCSEANRRGQGKEGSALIYNYKDDEYTQINAAAYLIILDSDKDIGYWYVKTDNKNLYYIEPKNAEKGFYLVFKEDGVLSITDLHKNKDYEVN